MVDSAGDGIAGPALDLFLASMVLVISILPYVQYGNNDIFTGFNIYAESLFALIATSVYDDFALSHVLLKSVDVRASKVLAALLGFTWIAVSGVMTFRAPFKQLGNGSHPFVRRRIQGLLVLRQALVRGQAH